MSAASVESESKMQTVDPECRPEQDKGLLLIGVFKLSKAVFFVGVSLGALHFIHHDLGKSLEHFFNALRFDNENRFVSLVLGRFGPEIVGKAEMVTHHRIRLFSMGTALYGILCSFEGVGLMRHRVWAEYLTLWLSASFVPWEAYELARRPGVWRLVILLMNLLITAYLVWLLRRKRQRSGS